MARLSRATSRLIIRPLDIGDFESWRSVDVLPTQNIWDRTPLPIQQRKLSVFKKILSVHKKTRDRDYSYDFGVFLEPTQLIGIVSVMEVSRSISQSAYIGYRIFNTHWGKGYGKEAAEALIDIAFKDLALHRVEAGIEPTNRRSILLARSIGLRKEGLKKRAVFLRNRWVDLVIYSATCDEFGIKWSNEAATGPSTIRHGR
jgi:ribosomal-protein-alanine N-acetyltransferase